MHTQRFISIVRQLRYIVMAATRVIVSSYSVKNLVSESRSIDVQQGSPKLHKWWRTSANICWRTTASTCGLCAMSRRWWSSTFQLTSVTSCTWWVPAAQDACSTEVKCLHEEKKKLSSMFFKGYLNISLCKTVLFYFKQSTFPFSFESKEYEQLKEKNVYFT